MKRYLHYILLFIFSLFFYTTCQALDRIHSGHVYLTSDELQTDVVKLTGEALFYHEQLYKLDDIQRDSTDQHYLPVGKSWNSLQNSVAGLSSQGYGTYYFTINIPQELVGQSFCLTPIDFISFASNITVNGKVCGGNGVVGVSRDDSAYTPSRYMQTQSFIADTCVLDVIIQCSNYQDVKGGIFNPLVFGLNKHVVRVRQRSLARDLFIITSLLIMGLYYMVAGCLNKSRIDLRYYSMLCFLLAVDLMFRGSASFFIFFPNLPFSFYSPLHLLTPFFLPGFIIFFMDALYPGYLHKKTGIIYFLTAFTCSVITLCGGALWNSYIIKPFFIGVSLLIFFGFKFTLKLVRANEFASRLFFCIYLILTLCIFNDVLNLIGIIHTISLFPCGVLLFVLFLGVIYGKRRKQLHYQLVVSTRNLEQKRCELEDKVGLRNNELRHSLKQLNKLHSVQKTVTSIIASDLKKSLEPLIHVDDVAPEDYPKLRDIGYHMLNMIHNMLDIYRFNNKRVVIQNSKFRPDKVITDVISDLTFLIKKKNVSVELIQEDSYELSADFKVFNRLIVNLLSNSLNHAPEGSLVQLCLKIIDVNILQVSISNQSPPLTEVQRGEVFTPYFLGDGISDLEARKSQLALYTCKLAVEAHGGTIGEDTTDTTGVTFKFTLSGAAVKHDNIDTSIVGISLSSHDKSYLLPFVQKLSCLEVYDLSNIELTIAQIAPKNDAIILWCNSINTACYHLDNPAYHSLLRMVSVECLIHRG